MSANKTVDGSHRTGRPRKSCERPFKCIQSLHLVHAESYPTVLGKTPLAAFCPIVIDSVVVVVRSKVRRRISRERFDLESTNSTATFRPVGLQHTGYDVTTYFRSAFIEVRRTAEMPLPTALGRIFMPRRLTRPTNGGDGIAK